MYSAITYNHKAFVKILLNPKLLEYQIITSKLHNVSNFFWQVNVVIIKNYNEKKKNSPRQNQRNKNRDVFFCKIRTCQQDVGYWF